MNRLSDDKLMQQRLPIIVGVVVLIAVLTTLLVDQALDNQLLIVGAAIAVAIITTLITYKLYLNPLVENQSALIHENELLVAQAQEQIVRLETLNHISESLTSAPDLESVLQTARKEIISRFDATAISISLLDETYQSLVWLYAFENGEEFDLTGEPASTIDIGFRGGVVKEGSYLLINDTTPEIMTKYNTVPIQDSFYSASFLGVPLKVLNEVVGVLAIENSSKRAAFNEDDAHFLETIGSPLAIAIQNKQLNSSMEDSLISLSQQSIRLQTASEVGVAISTISELDELLQATVKLVQERFILYYVGVFLVDKPNQTAVLQAGSGHAGAQQLKHEHTLPLNKQSLIGTASLEGAPIIVQDVSKVPNWLPNRFLPDTKSELAIPLMIGSDILGALTVQSKELNQFHPDLVKVLTIIGNQLAIAIHNTQLLNETKAQVKQQQLLNTVSTNLHQSADVDKILQVGLQAISKHFSDAPIKLQIGRNK